MWQGHGGVTMVVGKTMAMGWALPVVALGYRLAVLRRGSWGTALALGIAAWLTCLPNCYTP